MRITGVNLRCVRGNREVFAGLSFEAPAGRTLLVTGPNGAGKSSLLRLIAGLLRPAEGQIVVEGGHAELTLAEQAHYLGHLDPLKPSLTVGENLSFWAAFLETDGATMTAALAEVDLADLAALPGAYLSAGQRRRLSIARLLVAKRPIWLLDEPTAALDSAGQTRFAELMQEHLAAGGIVVATTHVPLGTSHACALQLASRDPACAR
jgi:heme exporter protein A